MLEGIHWHISVGLFSHGSLHRYVPGIIGETEKEWILTDQFEGINWKEMIRGKSFEFFEGLDSAGGDYLVAKNYNADELKEACLNTQHCVGFSSNGILKHSLQPPEMWRKYRQKDSKHGLYVLGKSISIFILCVVILAIIIIDVFLKPQGGSTIRRNTYASSTQE